MSWIINMKRLVSLGCNATHYTAANTTASTTAIPAITSALMSVSVAVLALILPLCLSLTTNAAEAVESKSLTHTKDQSIHYSGTAYSLDNDQILYREDHTLTMKDGQPIERTTLYYDADNQLFAEKNNRYRSQFNNSDSNNSDSSNTGSDNSATPDFMLTDDRYGYSESMEQDGKRWRVEYKEPEESGNKILSKPDYTPVIDAGFDEFVRAHWNDLMEGDTVNFSFAVPSRLEWIDFRLIPLAQKDGTLTVEMRLKSRWIAWLLDPVFLTYDIKSKRLLTYRGLTNIRTMNGDGIKAEIRYTYPLKDQS
ncbi:MAG: hypothetical protein COA68_00245 [Oceanobacter sp.]|nr:MAG: hypothetical protein COA68_00245 [Oceanobacter sp.]